LEEEQPKVSSRVLGYALIAVIGVSIIVVWYLNGYYEAKSSEVEKIKDRLTRLEGQVRQTARYVSVGNVTLSFEAFMPERVVSGTTITYLLGFATVSTLRNVVVRPIGVVVLFEPNVTWTGNGTVTYDYTDSQGLEVHSPELDEFSLPWGAFPINIENFDAGDEIIWEMVVRVEIIWMSYTVTETSLMVTYKFIIS